MYWETIVQPWPFESLPLRPFTPSISIPAKVCYLQRHKFFMRLTISITQSSYRVTRRSVCNQLFCVTEYFFRVVAKFKRRSTCVSTSCRQDTYSLMSMITIKPTAAIRANISSLVLIRLMLEFSLILRSSSFRPACSTARRKLSSDTSSRSIGGSQPLPEEVGVDDPMDVGPSYRRHDIDSMLRWKAVMEFNTGSSRLPFERQEGHDNFIPSWTTVAWSC